MAVAYLSSDTLTGIRTPLCWTPLERIGPPPLICMTAHGHRGMSVRPESGM